MNNHRIALAALACLALVLPGCQTVQDALAGVDKPTARIVDARLADLTADGLTLDFDVAVDNPYGAPLPLTDIAYSLASGGEPFLTGQRALDGTIPARGSRTVTVPTAINFDRLLEAVRGIEPGDVAPYVANLTLSADAPLGEWGGGPLSLPLTKSGEIPVPAAPEVSIERVGWDKLTLGEAAASIAMRVKNTNRFPIGVGDFSADIALGGREIGGSSLPAGLSLAPGEAGELTLPLSFRPRDFGMAMFNLIRGAEADYGLTGSTTITTPFGDVALPFDGAGVAELMGR